MTDHYLHLVAQRERILSTARISTAARARAMGQKQYAPIVDKPAVVARPIAEPVAKPVEVIPPAVVARIRIPDGMSRAGWGGPVPAEEIGEVSQKAKDIITVCCTVWQVSVDGVLSADRSRVYVRPRQAAMAMMATHLKLSQPAIGKIFKRDHSTVTHAATHKVPELLARDRGFRVRYAYAVRLLRKMWAQP